MVSHKKFKAKYELPYTLLADEDHSIAESYGVWVDKSSFGVTRKGIARTTFVIDRQGRVARVFEKVKPDHHADEVAEAVAAIK